MLLTCFFFFFFDSKSLLFKIISKIPFSFTVIILISSIYLIPLRPVFFLLSLEYNLWYRLTHHQQADRQCYQQHKNLTLLNFLQYFYTVSIISVTVMEQSCCFFFYFITFFFFTNISDKNIRIDFKWFSTEKLKNFFFKNAFWRED